MTTERTYPNNPVGRSFVRSMGGAALGCLTVILLALPSGLSLSLLSFYGGLLIVSTTLSTIMTTILARFWHRHLGAIPVMAGAGPLSTAFSTPALQDVDGGPAPATTLKQQCAHPNDSVIVGYCRTGQRGAA